MLDDVDSGAGLADPVVKELGLARRAIGDDGHFGIELAGWTLRGDATEALTAVGR